MIAQGSHFRYELPDGWRVAEEGAHALVLLAPDAAAGIVVFGLSGLPAPFDPPGFAHYAMAQAMRLAPDVQLAMRAVIAPRPGYTHAALLDTRYSAGGIPVVGQVVSNVALGYGFSSGAITIASARADRWGEFAPSLLRVALEAVNVGPNAYGAAGMAAAMHGIAAQEGAANAAYRQWSQATWAEVTRERDAAVGRQQAALDPVLTNQQWSADPYGGAAVRHSATPAVIWVHRDGRQVSSPDPSYDPRTPMDADWRRMK